MSVIEEEKAEAPSQDGTAKLFLGSLEIRDDYLLSKFDKIEEPTTEAWTSNDQNLSPDASRSTIMETVSRLGVGLLSYAKPKDENLNTFTLGIDYKLEEDV